MAIETQYTLDQLRELCIQLQIPVTIKKNKEYKEDYVLALRKYWITKHFGSISNIPWALNFMLNYVPCPMLCKRYQQCKPEIKNLMWESDDYIVEEKINGLRCLVCFNSDTQSFDFYSRNNSIKDFLPQNYKESIYLTFTGFHYPTSFVLDCEVIYTHPHIPMLLKNRGFLCTNPNQTLTNLLSINPLELKYIQKQYPLKFVVFDCLFDGENLINNPWTDRHIHAESLVRELKKVGFLCEINPVIRRHKLEFYSDIVEQNKEGVVLKNCNSPYIAKTSRTDNMVKLKCMQYGELNKDIDAWVSGFVPPKNTDNPNLIGGLVFSCTMQMRDGTIKEQKIAICDVLPDEIRQMATLQINDKPSLNPTFLGRVATLNGTSFNARRLTLTQPIIQCWRPDKEPNGCEILEEEELRNFLIIQK